MSVDRRFWPTLATWTANGDELVYSDYGYLMDTVSPINGGRVKADGTWIQQPHRTDTPFARALPGLAREVGQGYWPVLEGFTHADWQGLLANPGAWAATVADMVAMINARFDAPWDGVLFAFEGALLAQQAAATALLSLMAAALHAEGYPVWMNVRGREADNGLDYPGAYALDYAALNGVLDGFIYGIVGYWAPPPRSIGPYWWAEASLDYALHDCGIAAEKLCVNLGSWCKQETGGGGTTYFYDDAIALIGAAPIEWLEANDDGLNRQKYATLIGGTMWINDGRWVQDRLPLVDARGIEVISCFWPRGLAPDTWQAIADWKRPSGGCHQSSPWQPAQGASRPPKQRLSRVSGPRPAQPIRPLKPVRYKRRGVTNGTNP